MKKFKRTLCVVLSITLLLCSVFSASALSKYGSRGQEVKEIQTRLKKWGYYSGSVDGIYGTATKNAVIKFQKKIRSYCRRYSRQKDLRKNGY